jgi:hypothetical protein
MENLNIGIFFSFQNLNNTIELNNGRIVNKKNFGFVDYNS